MKYISTRGAAPTIGFADALLAGLATDGGLYLPEFWPTLPPLDELRGRTYSEVAAKVMWPFVEEDIDRDVFDALVAEAYSVFDDPAGVPGRRPRSHRKRGQSPSRGAFPRADLRLQGRCPAIGGAALRSLS
ncbi:MAG: hypothetical protein V9F03_14215 [Microthrixaceae bacterium]